jgi:hypothetical protein
VHIERYVGVTITRLGLGLEGGWAPVVQNGAIEIISHRLEFVAVSSGGEISAIMQGSGWLYT